MVIQVQESDDRHMPLQHIIRRRGTSLASDIEGIARHAEKVEKAHKWARNLMCLRYHDDSPHVFEKFRNVSLERAFVAVSWTWNPSSHESSTRGKYSVKHSGTGRVETPEIRDCILERVVRYLVSNKYEIFWMDKMCINQNNLTEKQSAIQSMDLVYRSAEKSVALLSTPIRSRLEAMILNQIMNGRLVTMVDGCGYRLRRIDWRMTKKAIKLLCRLTKDLWWTRGWTFQEEYVAGLSLDLLFPLIAGIRTTPGSGNTPHEYCISAVTFRTQATTIALASQESIRRLEQRLGSQCRYYDTACSKILDVARRYARTISGAMSAHICADVGRRQTTYPWDSLAIIANSCGYEIRLDRRVLQRGGHSLSICLLTQFLLNGEVVSFDLRDDVLNLPISKLLQRISLKAGCLPVTSRQLTFLKSCRFPEIRLRDYGWYVKGYLWELRVNHKLRTRHFQLSRISKARAGYLEHCPWEAPELESLVYELQIGHHAVGNLLLRYIDGRKRGREWCGSRHMDLMAWNLVVAIRNGYVLRIGYTEDGSAGGIFIPARDDIRRPMTVFTSWQPSHQFENVLDKFVSIEVLPRHNQSWSARQWMRGLVFLSGLVPQAVMIGTL